MVPAHNQGLGAFIPIIEFYSSRKRGRCQACTKARRMIYYDSVGESLLSKYGGVRSRAALRGHEFTLTFEEYAALVSQPCAYAIDWHEVYAPVLIEMDSSLGYISDNCAPCCASITCSRVTSLRMHKC